jgi:prefoldin alpha subunit
LSTDEEAIRRLVVELRLLEGSIKVNQSRLDIIEAALNDILMASNTLEGVKNQQKGAEALIPVGAGSFIRAELSDVEKIIMGVGAGVCVERTVDNSLNELKSRFAELEKVRVSLQQQLAQALSKLEDGRRRLSELLRKKGEGKT